MISVKDALAACTLVSIGISGSSSAGAARSKGDDSPAQGRASGVPENFAGKSFMHLAAVFLSLVLLGGSPAVADTDQAACYGETLEVSLLTLFDDDGEIQERTVFALPSPNAWLVTLKGGGHLHDVPCQDEPIEVSKVWGGFIDARLGHGTFGIPGAEGVRIRWIRLSDVDAKSVERSEQFHISTNIDEGVLTETGFYRRKGQNTTATGGGWVFPEAYQSPIGTKIYMSCTPTCKIRYRLFRNLSMTYEILLDDENAIPDWIAIDRYARSAILNWIVEKE